MAYFPNGTSAEIYEEQYCRHCRHQRGPDGETGCAVMLAHLLHNYEECNNPDSILHLLIPLGKDGLGNAKCGMFSAWDDDRCRETADLFAERA